MNRTAFTALLVIAGAVAAIASADTEVEEWRNPLLPEEAPARDTAALVHERLTGSPPPGGAGDPEFNRVLRLDQIPLDTGRGGD